MKRSSESGLKASRIGLTPTTYHREVAPAGPAAESAGACVWKIRGLGRARRMQRLLGVVDFTLVLGLALLAGGLAAVCPWPTAAAVVVTLVLARRRVTFALLLAAAGAVVLNAARAGRAVARFDRERAEVRAALA